MRRPIRTLAVAATMLLGSVLALPALAATKSVSTPELTKAQAELAVKLTARNIALRELAKQVNVLPPSASPSSSRDLLLKVRTALQSYQRATTGAADGSLGGDELQQLHVTIASALASIGSAPDPLAAPAVLAMRRVQLSQLDARNAKATLRVQQIAALRNALPSGPVLLVPDKPLAKAPGGRAAAARDGDAPDAALQTGADATQVSANTGTLEITVTDAPATPAATTATSTVAPGGQTASANNLQMFIADGGIGAVQGGTVVIGNTTTLVVTLNSTPSADLFSYASQIGAFRALSVPTACSLPTATTSNVGSLFAVDSSTCTDSSTSTATAPASCPSGTEWHAGMCYTPCKSGYSGHATMCVYEPCPTGFRNDGLFCAKPAGYGRGVGYPWKLGDTLGSLDQARARCAKDNPDGCEKNGEMIYAQCRSGYRAIGSNICSPVCPSAYTDIGASCKKPVYDRGMGVRKS